MAAIHVCRVWCKARCKQKCWGLCSSNQAHGSAAPAAAPEQHCTCTQVMLGIGSEIVVVDADAALRQPAGGAVTALSIAPEGQYVACCTAGGHLVVRTLDLSQASLRDQGPASEQGPSVHALPQLAVISAHCLLRLELETVVTLAKLS